MPDTQTGHDTAELINRGILSVVFRSKCQSLRMASDGPPCQMARALRTITRAKLHGVGIVDSPAYSGSLISQRALEYALGIPEDGHRKGQRSYGCNRRAARGCVEPRMDENDLVGRCHDREV